MTETAYSSGHILVVEDQADLRKLLALTLGPLGRRLVELADAGAALRHLDENAPDLVLLDLMLPGGADGLEVCRRIKSDPRLAATRVILMTAADQADVRERVASAGADHYLPKPFSPRQLRELAASLLDRPSMTQETHG